MFHVKQKERENHVVLGRFRMLGARKYPNRFFFLIYHTILYYIYIYYKI
jgi:hypothetical protein